MEQTFGMGKFCIKNKLNLTKTGVPRWRIFLPQTSSPKPKLFNLLSFTHENFRVGKYEEKIKDGKIWDIKMKGSPLNAQGQQKFELLNH